MLTVGAYSHEGTVVRTDDVMAGYSSRGPTAIDFQAKPDLVAPGTGIVSLSSASSTMYYTKPEYLLSGSFGGGYKPYLSLTGTSMAAPVVSGTVALMLQANPSLTPNMVKAILQYTAQIYPGYNALTQGAGFLNAQGAVQLARFFRTAQSGSQLTIPSEWGRQVIWGNHRITGGVIRPNANAFQLGTTWGSAFDRDGDNIVWGTLQRRRQHRVGHRRPAERRQPGVGHGSRPRRRQPGVGHLPGRRQPRVGHDLRRRQHRVGHGLRRQQGLRQPGLGHRDHCRQPGVGHGAGRRQPGVGHGARRRQPGVGHGAHGDNLVWGTSGDVDNLVWGTSAEGDNMTWGNSGEDAPLFDDPIAEPVSFDQTVFESLFSAPLVTAPVSEENALTQPITSTLGVVGILGGL